MAAAYHRPDQVIFVSTPNNPTGTAVRRGGAARSSWTRSPRLPGGHRRGLRAVRSPSRRPLRPEPVRLLLERGGPAEPSPRPTGWPGCGSAIWSGHEPVAQAVRKTMLPFTVNSLAQAAAIASLAAEAELLERVELVVKERDRVRHELLGQGWSVPPTEANFVWLPLATGQRTSRRPVTRQASASGRMRRTESGSRLPTRRPTTRSWPRPPAIRTAPDPLAAGPCAVAIARAVVAAHGRSLAIGQNGSMVVDAGGDRDRPGSRPAAHSPAGRTYPRSSD